MGRALNRILLVAAAVFLSAGTSTKAGSSTVAEALPSLAKDLYVALTQHQSSDVIAPLVERAVLKSGRACAPLRDYQILPPGKGIQHLKVKCAEQPTYRLAINPSDGGVRVSGGDGTVQPINPQDGPVTAVWGMRAERYLADEARRSGASSPVPATAMQRGVAAAAGVGNALRPAAGWNSLLWAGLLLTLLLAVPLLVWFNTRPAQVLGFTSEDKDQMVEEAEEILPEIYFHPQGWFIVRGQRGKRRVFRTLLFAYLYRNYGLKLREVR